MRGRVVSPADGDEQSVVVHYRLEALQRLLSGLLELLRARGVGGIVRDKVHQNVPPLHKEAGPQRGGEHASGCVFSFCGYGLELRKMG